MLHIILAQLNFHVGNIDANVEKIIAAIKQAEEKNADLIVFPELAITGYPPEDLLFREDFSEAIEAGLEKIIQATGNIDAIIGYPHKDKKVIYNAAAVVSNKRLVTHYYKQCLPNHAIFDEKRYFTPGDKNCILELNGIKIGIIICEDIWQKQPMISAKEAGAELIVNLSASPFHYAKASLRYETLRARQQDSALPIVYVNPVGAQDEIIFDGGSFALDADGGVLGQADYFKEQLLSIQYPAADATEQSKPFLAPKKSEIVYNALVLAVRDYAKKNAFKGALIGLSGGIDSALTLAIAADALGSENIRTVMMPTEYTSSISLDDAKQQADSMGVQYSIFPIEDSYHSFLSLLKDEFSETTVDTTEQNIQARCRAIVLMALSNKFGKLLISTGNKSETSVGYSTLYGDMAGGFSVLKDVPKTLVYQLATYRNSLSAVIPERVITREPSAELAANQVDSDSLPAYSILDDILERYVEHDQAASEIIAAGFDSATVKRVIKLVKNNEYKRRQGSPGPRITPRSYGRDRRYPISSGFDPTKY